MRLRQPLNATRKKPAPAVATHESIEDRVAAFLEAGGKIQHLSLIHISEPTRPY